MMVSTLSGLLSFWSKHRLEGKRDKEKGKKQQKEREKSEKRREEGKKDKMSSLLNRVNKVVNIAYMISSLAYLHDHCIKTDCAHTPLHQRHLKIETDTIQRSVCGRAQTILPEHRIAANMFD